ncbi:MAG: branched-chain amino acid ABC transporter permease, partial [Pseudomonas sp. PGPPP3]
AGAVALACHGLPYQLGLLAAAVSGIAIGLYLERRQGLQVVEEAV